MDFSGKIVLVTGGSRGIGRPVAHGFADRGARVAPGFVDTDMAAWSWLHSQGDSDHKASAAAEIFRLDPGQRTGLSGHRLVIGT